MMGFVQVLGQSYYCSVRVGFSKLLEKTYKICIYTLKKKRSARDLLDVYAFFFLIFLYKGIYCGYSFELHLQVDAI